MKKVTPYIIGEVAKVFLGAALGLLVANVLGVSVTCLLVLVLSGVNLAYLYYVENWHD